MAAIEDLAWLFEVVPQIIQQGDACDSDGDKERVTVRMSNKSFIISAKRRRLWPKASTFQQLQALAARLDESGLVTMIGGGAGSGFCEVLGQTDLSDESLVELVRSLRPPGESELIVVETKDGTAHDIVGGDGDYKISRTIAL